MMIRYRIRLLLFFSCFLTAVPAAAARVQVKPFRIYSINSYPQLGKKLADLLIFRLGMTPGIRASGTVPIAGVYRRILCSVNISRISISLSAAVYYKQEQIPENRFRLKADGLENIYSVIEQAARKIIQRLPGRRRIRNNRPLDIVFCLDVSGSMHLHVPDYRRGILESLNSLERTLAHTAVHQAAVVFRSGKIIRNTPLKPARYPVLKAVRGLHAWSRSSGSGSLSAVLRKSLLRRSWRSEAVKTAVLFTKNPGSRYLHGLGSALARRGIHLIIMIPPDCPAASSATLREFARAGSGTALDVPVLIRWIRKGERGSFFWEQGRVYRFRSRIPNSRIPFIRPQLMRFDNGVRIFRARNLREALRIGSGKIGSRIIGTGSAFSRAMLTGLRRILRRKGIPVPSDLPAGRILLESGGIRFWTEISDKNLLRKLSFYRGTGEFWLGAHPVPAPHRQSGFLLHPGLFILPPPGTRIAELAHADAVRLSRRASFYSRNGILSPPRWFLRVRLHKIEKYRLSAPSLKP